MARLTRRGSRSHCQSRDFRNGHALWSTYNLANQIKKGPRLHQRKHGYVAVEDVVSVAHQLMDAPRMNALFLERKLELQRNDKEVAELLGKNHQLPLSSSLLYLGWALESILSALGVHKKFLSSLLPSDTSVLDGTKVKRELTSITAHTPYLKESVLFFR